jgi:hypothetical protein
VSDQTAVAEVLHADAPLMPMSATSTSALVLDESSMTRMMELAKVMSTGIATIPKHLQKNQADCLAVVMQAMQWKMNPFAVAQKTHLVSGTLGYEAQLVNAVITSMAPTKDRLHFEWFGKWEAIVGKFKEVESKTKKDDDGHFKKYRVPAWDVKAEDGLGVRVWATLKGEDEPRELTLLMTQARTRNSTLWTDDPKQQLAYLATKRWSRLYCPDVILGVYTPDELDEEPMRDVAPQPRTGTEFGRQARPAVQEDDPERQKLIARLEKLTKQHGADALAKEWGTVLTKQQRLSIGPDELARIKELVPHVEPAAAVPAAQDAAASAEPSADTNAPTYAELMEHIKKAGGGDDLQQVISDASHLPQNLLEEITTAALARSKEIGNG